MLKDVFVPDIGANQGVSVIEVLVAPNATIHKDAALITLETDKASMEIPSPYEGVVKSVQVKVGDKVSEGDLIITMEIADHDPKKEEKPEKTEKPEKPEKSDVVEDLRVLDRIPDRIPKKQEKPTVVEDLRVLDVHAGPGVRRFARELGVDLGKVKGSGRKSRIVFSDVKQYVKNILTGSGSSAGIAGLNIVPWPQIDHAKFGPIKQEPLPRIKKLSGGFLHRNWVMVPHVTQFDEADITELEHFRKENQALAEAQNLKLTPLVFIMKAVVAALKAFPTFNASLDASGSELILKQYFHLGVAVDTPNGLVVPVVRDVDQKGLFQLAKELGELSAKARGGKLTAQEMQGSSFSISSLGGIGGTYFTPIVNVPDVAILGISKSQIKPIFLENEFKPRLMLPLSLSYDHRVIDGAEAARFTSFLVKQLSDIRRLLL